MAQAYFSLVTHAGRIKLAESAAGGDAVTISHFAVGDGNGADTNPTASSTALVREVWRTSVENVATDPDNPSAILVTAIIPTNAGGWWMREFGVFDKTGTMIAVARPVSQYKPTALEGQLEDIRYEFQIIIGDNANVTLLVDPSLLMASREWVATRRIAMSQLVSMPFVPVKSTTTTVPPTSPLLGDIYVIPNTATGAWAGHGQKLAEWGGADWAIVSTSRGHVVGTPDGVLYINIDGDYLPYLSTTEETLAGVIDTKPVHPKGLKAAINEALSTLPEDKFLTLASLEQTVAGDINTMATHPAGVRAALDHHSRSLAALNFFRGQL